MLHSIDARQRRSAKSSAAERKAERSLNHAVFAVRNQWGGYLDDELEETQPQGADWQALCLILAGVGFGVAVGLLLAPKRL